MSKSKIVSFLTAVCCTTVILLGLPKIALANEVNNQNLIPTMSSNTSPFGIASSSGNFQDSEYAPWKAFDGNNESGICSRWISRTGIPQWISFTFNQPTYVGSYYILPETGENSGRAPKDFALQGSNDNKNWLTIDSRRNIGLSSWKSTGLTFGVNSPGYYKSYRLVANSNNEGSSPYAPVVSIQSFKLFPNSAPSLIPVMTSNSSLLGQASSSSNYDNIEYAPWKAFDGNNESGICSRWISSTGMPQYISYTFNEPVYASSYYILPETGSCGDRAPKNFQLQGSNNGISWKTIDSRKNITLDKWTSNQTFYISNSGWYKCYRLLVSAVNGSDVVSIQHFRLY